MAEDSIDAARILTDTVGALHEIQRTQLSHWPMVAFFDATSSEAHVDIGEARSEKDKDGNFIRKNRLLSVFYQIQISKESRPRNYKTKWKSGANLLRKWTKEMFWQDTNVKVFVNSKEVKPDGRKKETKRSTSSRPKTRRIRRNSKRS